MKNAVIRKHQLGWMLFCVCVCVSVSWRYFLWIAQKYTSCTIGVVMVDAATGSGKSTLVPLCLAQQCLEESNINERAALLLKSNIWNAFLGCSSWYLHFFHWYVWGSCYYAAVLVSLRLVFLDVLVPVPFLFLVFWPYKFHSMWLLWSFSPSLCIQIFQRTYCILNVNLFGTSWFSASHDMFDSWVAAARKENRGCRIVVTQPRRIAAKGLAARVSQQAEGSRKVLHGKWSIINWYS